MDDNGDEATERRQAMKTLLKFQPKTLEALTNNVMF